MKKYIVPAAQIINFTAENLIAMSLQDGLSSKDNQLTRQHLTNSADWEDDEELLVEE